MATPLAGFLKMATTHSPRIMAHHTRVASLLGVLNNTRKGIASAAEARAAQQTVLALVDKHELPHHEAADLVCIAALLAPLDMAPHHMDVALELLRANFNNMVLQSTAVATCMWMAGAVNALAQGQYALAAQRALQAPNQVAARVVMTAINALHAYPATLAGLDGLVRMARSLETMNSRIGRTALTAAVLALARAGHITAAQSIWNTACSMSRAQTEWLHLVAPIQ